MKRFKNERFTVYNIKKGGGRRSNFVRGRGCGRIRGPAVYMVMIFYLI